MIVIKYEYNIWCAFFQNRLNYSDYNVTGIQGKERSSREQGILRARQKQREYKTKTKKAKILSENIYQVENSGNF